MKIVKIVSDGYGHGTKIFTDTGEKIENVRAVKWEVDVNSSAVVTMELVDVECDVKGEVEDKKLK